LGLTCALADTALEGAARTAGVVGAVCTIDGELARGGASASAGAAADVGCEVSFTHATIINSAIPAVTATAPTNTLRC
jgi:hypothetical protein